MNSESTIVFAWKMVRRLRLGTMAGLLLVMHACASSAAAIPLPPAPEIDAGSLASALTLLTGGLLILTDRLRKK